MKVFCFPVQHIGILTEFARLSAVDACDLANLVKAWMPVMVDHPPYKCS